jgi:hypothetical protein
VISSYKLNGYEEISTIISSKLEPITIHMIFMLYKQWVIRKYQEMLGIYHFVLKYRTLMDRNLSFSSPPVCRSLHLSRSQCLTLLVALSISASSLMGCSHSLAICVCEGEKGKVAVCRIKREEEKRKKRRKENKPKGEEGAACVKGEEEKREKEKEQEKKRKKGERTRGSVWLGENNVIFS